MVPYAIPLTDEESDPRRPGENAGDAGRYDGDGLSDGEADGDEREP